MISLRLFGKQLTLTFILTLNSVFALAQFQVNGNAVMQNDSCYRLTQAQNNQSGSVWSTTQISLDNDFEIYFDLSLGNNSSGADGMTFAFQQVSSTATGVGSGMGIAGISPSLFIEFDTYSNIGNTDLAADHVALMKNGNVDHASTDNIAGPFSALPSLANIDDGNYHLTNIKWDYISATQQNIKMYFDCNLRIDYTADFINTIFGGNLNVFWGLTGSTSGLNNLQQFCFRYISPTISCNDITIYLNSDGQASIDTSDVLDSAYSVCGINEIYLSQKKFLCRDEGVNQVTLYVEDNSGNIDSCISTVTVLDTFKNIYIDTTICEGDTFSLMGFDYYQTGNYYDTIFGLDTLTTLNIEGTSVAVTPVPYISYGHQEPSLYSNYTTQGAAVGNSLTGYSFQRLSAPFWRGNGVLADRLVNILAYWQAGIPSNTWFGASFSIDVPTSKVYYIVLAADDQFRISVDGTIQITSDGAAIRAAGQPFGSNPQASFIRAHIYPFYLTEGCHIVTLEGLDFNSTGMFAGAILNNDSAEIVNATSLSDLNFIFRTDEVDAFYNNIVSFSCLDYELETNSTSCAECQTCTRYINVNLTVDSIETIVVDTNLCYGESITLNNINYSTDQSNTLDTAYYDQSGCDSIHYDITIHVDTAIIITSNDTICEGSSVIVNGVSYMTTGQYYDTAYYAQSGCDSIHYDITVNVNSANTEQIVDSICENSSRMINGVTYTMSGQYYDTAYYAQSGCDSIHYDITLTINDLNTLSIDTTICNGESFIFNGINYTSEGTYIDTLQGIDSIVAKIDTTNVNLPVGQVSSTAYGWGQPVLYDNYTADGAAVADGSINGFSFTELTDNFWRGNGNINNSIVNNLGVWGVAVPNNQWFGASFPIDVPSSQTYYVLLAADNFFRFSIDGVVQITSNGTAITSNGQGGFAVNGVSFNRLHIYPIQLTSGCHFITFEGNNSSGIGMFGGAIISNTSAEITSATSNTDLDYLFSTATTTTFSSGIPNFICPTNSIPLGNESCDSCLLLECDTIVTINLSVDSADVEQITDTICEGSSVMINGVSYMSPGQYLDTAYYAQSGCDSIHYDITIHVDSADVEQITDTICEGSSVMINGVSYMSSGQYLDTAYYAQSGCDSIHYDITIHVDSADVEQITDTICEGSSLMVNGVSYMSPGQYFDTLYYVQSGCDSIHYDITIHVDSADIEQITDTICEGASVMINGVSYMSPGQYLDTAYYAQSGCDSIHYDITIHVDSADVEQITDTICEGSSVMINGVSYMTPGQYFDTLYYVQSGCDSIHYDITIHVDSADVEQITDTICEGSSLMVNGVSYMSPGQYFDTLYYVQSGCDSIHYDITIHVDSADIEQITDTICEGASVMINGVSYMTPGQYLDTAYYAQSGCDSIHYDITIHVDSADVEQITDTICEGSSVMINGVSYMTPGQYLDTAYYAQSGCDSIHYDITIHVDSADVEQITDTICEGSSVMINGVSYMTPGQYLDTAYYAQSGCDSIHYDITIHVDSANVEQITDTICEGSSVMINGVSYMTPGQYLDTVYYAQSGCDSIHYDITIHVDSADVEQITDTICEGSSVMINGVSYMTPGQYLDTAYYAQSGCDSIHYDITIHVDSADVEQITDTICEGSSLMINGVSYMTPGQYLDTAYYAQSGCDSIHYDITIHVDSADVEQITDTICEGSSVMINGVSYMTPGQYLDTAYYAQSGCDSIHYDITIHVDSADVEQITDTICEGSSVMINGVSYMSPGQYLDTAYYAQSGCDSIHYDITIHVDSADVEQITDTICEGSSVMINGVSYMSPGQYLDTAYYAQSGCDSIHYIIDLIVNPTFDDTISALICANEFYTLADGTQVNTNGVYSIPYFTVNNCDSIYSIDLTVAPLPIGAKIDSICQGDSLFLGGEWQKTAGIYIDTISNGINCDSILNTTLFINSLPTVIANASNLILCLGEPLTLTGVGAIDYNWNNGVTDNDLFIPAVGNYQYVVTGIDANMCEDNDTIDVVVNEAYNITNNVTICESVLPYNFPDGSQHNLNSDFTQVSSLSTVNNCDSIIVTNLTVNKLGIIGLLPDTIAVCESFNQSLELNSQNIVSYQWQVNSGVGFTNLVDGGIYIGTQSNELIISPLDENLTGNIYRIEMFDECGFSLYSNEVFLRVTIPHDVLNPIPDVTKCLRDSSLLFIDYNGFNYVWSDGQIGQYFKVNQSGTYTVTYTEKLTNCDMEDEIEIFLNDCIDDCVISLPTAFSPDKTLGKNDIFKIITNCNEGFTFYELNIFNRWGELIFSSTDLSKGWDGKFKGVDLDIGIYTYVLSYIKKGKTDRKTTSGTVTLVR